MIISKCLIKPLSILRIHLLLKWKKWIFWHLPPILFLFWIFVVQSLSHVRLFVTLGWQYARLPHPSLSPGGCSNSCALSWWWYPIIWSSVALFSSCPQSFPAPGSFSNESTLCIRWPKYWSFSFSISLSNEYSGLISFRIDWFDLHVQESSLAPQFSKASVLQCSAFFMVQHSHPYMTTGKTLSSSIQTSVSKVMSLLFNTLSRFVITFLPRNKCLLISWLESLSSVILEPKKSESAAAFTFSPSILPRSDGARCHDLSFFHVEF